MKTPYQTTYPGLLAKERTFAGPGFNRWLIPPAALAVHLCIGMAYGFSVFWLPLSHTLGITKALVCPTNMSFIESLVNSNCDWKISQLGWIFTLFFVFLGSAAAILGGWAEHVGPRKAGFVAALCWCSGLVMTAIGVYYHQLWLLWLGSGVIGGIGLGLGYISPVSTLIKWFPDHRGMAAGLAIMGFGGGAMIGAPLADLLMKFYATPVSVGVWQTFLTLAAIYLLFMMGGALSYRLPPLGWQPKGWAPIVTNTNAMITNRNVHVNTAWKTPQFWLIWWVLCLNVSAGIGIIGMASPMLQEVFGGRLLGINISFNDLSLLQKGQIAALAAGFTGLLSLFNIGGRLFWATFSDYIGRKTTYSLFFILGFLLYVSAPFSAYEGSVLAFVAAFCIILSMYGGGFATLPAYLADMFGTQMVGAIHGRLLTAWSAAGILGPVIVNYLREYQIAHGVALSNAYDTIAYVLAGLLLLGFICNAMIRPVAAKYFMTEEQLEAERKLSHETASRAIAKVMVSNTLKPSSLWIVIMAWLVVALPLLWGVWHTLMKAKLIFGF